MKSESETFEYKKELFAKKIRALMEQKGMINQKGEPDKVALYNFMNPNNPITEEQRKDKSYVDTQTRKIRDWLTGKFYPRELSLTLAICNDLHCGFDYLFTDMEAPTHDIEFASKETGLSINAIMKLQEATGYERQMLSVMLENGYFKEILYAVYTYMQTFYKEISEKDPQISERKLQNKEKMEYAEFRASKHFTNLLVDKLASNKDIRECNDYEHNGEIIQKYVESVLTYLESPQGQKIDRISKELLKKYSYNEICDTDILENLDINSLDSEKR